MDIEIVGAYITTHEEESVKGTLHVFLQCRGLGIDLRGVFWMKRNGKYLFRLPDRHAIDADTGQKVRFPIFSFADRAQTDKLMTEIRKSAPEFIDKKLACKSG